MGVHRLGENNKAPDDMDSEMLSRHLRGNTLLVYWYMLRSNKPHSSREIQRATGISSPSLALHHLNRLIEMGLAVTDSEGRYVVAKRIRPGLLDLFVGMGRLFIPRFAFYSVFTTTLLITSIVLFWPILDPASALLIASLSVISCFLWWETIRLWRNQPV